MKDVVFSICIVVVLVAAPVSFSFPGAGVRAWSASSEGAASGPPEDARAGTTWTEPMTGMEFVWVPPGCCQMGCGSADADCDADEKPAHEVCVNGFWLGKYPVTQGVWQAVIGDNPSHFDAGDDYPVENVSWEDAREFIRRFNSLAGGRYEFRLPSEAQWEYACRSGGGSEKYAGGEDVDKVAWFDGNSGGTTHPVGTKAPNGLGIYDMSGDVWQWCEDVYLDTAYAGSEHDNPLYVYDGSGRVLRGGGWSSIAKRVRCGYRRDGVPSGRLPNVGLRLVKTP